MPVLRLSEENYERLRRYGRPWEAPDDTLGRVLEIVEAVQDPRLMVEAPPPVANGRKIETEADYVRGMNATVRPIWDRVRERVIKFGGVTIGANENYIKLVVNGRNFAEVAKRKDRLRILVRPEGHDLERGGTIIENGLRLWRQPATSAWTIDVNFEVTLDTDLDVVEAMLRMSYDAVRR
jgi:hypothetical protein